MKRSEINRRIREGIEFFDQMNFKLPPWALFSPADWRKVVADAAEIFELQLGWDVTAFGSEDFLHTGLLLFTLRNGLPGSTLYPKPYAEKNMMVRENQVTPRHFHWYKREDIINRGGGNLIIELFHADPERNVLVPGKFRIAVNGLRRELSPGDRIILTPGDSVALEPIHAHRFYGEPGSGNVLVGEVSMVNDDTTDNCFIDGVPRFDPVEEDEEPEHLLAAEYRQHFAEVRHA